MSNPEIPLLHRDDLPYPLAEALIKQMREMYPGCQIVFLGDQPEGEVPGEVMDHLRAMGENIARSMAGGTCRQCGGKMPCEWPPPPGPGELTLPEGWLAYDVGDELTYFMCPACEAATPVIEFTTEDEDQD